MKKTIIALLALAGVAAADTLVSVTENLTVSSTDISLDTAALSLTLDSTSGASAPPAGTYLPAEFTGATGFSPKIQFVQNKNDECYWLLEMTITNKTNSAITLTGLTLDMYSTTSNGSTHTGGIGEVTTTLTYGDADTEFGSGTVTLGANSASGTATITGAYELAAKADETFTLKVQRTQNSGLTGFASISAATLSYKTVAAPAVPEPTTATLSLLALAGLAARRRRK